MKKIISVLLAVFSFVMLIPNVFAASTDNRVYAESISIDAGDEFSIPIKIENNKGFMGFSIVLTYDKSAFTPVSVSKGSILNGMLDDSISTSKDNSFKVIFTASGNITSNGTLVTVKFKSSDKAKGRQTIKISYSKEDTFNEKWQDVKLNCENVTVNINNDSIVEPVVTEKKTSEKMLEWFNKLPKALKYPLWIIIVPIAYIISLFE